MTDLNPVDAMTNLSPAARAVLDAACDSLDRRGYIRDQVAAALRAAADQLAYTDSEGRQFIHVPELLAIATELEPNAQ